MPRGGISKRQLKAIYAKLKKGNHVGFENMKIYLMNERNEQTGEYFTADEANNIAGSIYRRQVQNKKQIAREKK